MGTSMAFYHIKNRGFDREQLRDGLNRLPRSKNPMSQFEEMMKSLVGEEMFRLAQRETMAERQHFNSIFGVAGERPQLPSPMVAYCPDAAWLPFFDVNICEGYNASSESIHRLSEVFQAPILSFSIYDSDILMVSYSDAAQNIAYDYAKPNCEEMVEYDTKLFRAEFPRFLLDIAPGVAEETLREIWDAEEVFADDRMTKLSKVLQAIPIYDEAPEGFEIVTAK